MGCLLVIFRSFFYRTLATGLRPALTAALIVTVAGLTGLIAASLPTPAQARQVSVEEAAFVVTLDKTPDDEATYSYQSNLVPFLPGHSCYGWRLRLSDAGKVVTFREVLTLPSDPAYWPHEPSEFDITAKSRDRTTTVTERHVAPEEGWIGNGWCVLEGDPKGAYSVEISINGQFAQRFDFEVRDVPAGTH